MHVSERCGADVVMSSKNLLEIAVEGTSGNPTGKPVVFCPSG